MSRIGVSSQSGIIQDASKLLAKGLIAWLLLGNALSLDFARKIRAESPQTTILLRTGNDWAYKDQSFNHNYRDIALRVAEPFQKEGLCDFLLPPNEPVITNDVEARQLNDAQVWLAGEYKAHGYRTGAYNFSVGNPDTSLWPYLIPGIRACDGWLFLHEYDLGATHSEYYVWTSLRHRSVFPLIPSDVNLKIGITECLDDLGTERHLLAGQHYQSQQ